MKISNCIYNTLELKLTQNGKYSNLIYSQVNSSKREHEVLFIHKFPNNKSPPHIYLWVKFTFQIFMLISVVTRRCSKICFPIYIPIKVIYFDVSHASRNKYNCEKSETSMLYMEHH